MVTLWYCCGCNFGPFNADLYDSCVNCGQRACSSCPREKVPYRVETLNHSQPPRNPPQDAPKPAIPSLPRLSPRYTPKQAAHKRPEPPSSVWKRLAPDLLRDLPQQDSQEPPSIPINRIYDSTLKLLIQFVRQCGDGNHRNQSRGELERLFLWGESLSTSTLDETLDATLRKSPELFETIVFTLGELDNVVKNSLSQNMRAVSGEEENISGTIDDISVYIDCLMDLSPAIESHLLDHFIIISRKPKAERSV